MENPKGFTYPEAIAKCDKITIYDQKIAICDLKRDHGDCRSRPIFV